MKKKKVVMRSKLMTKTAAKWIEKKLKHVTVNPVTYGKLQKMKAKKRKLKIRNQHFTSDDQTWRNG